MRLDRREMLDHLHTLAHYVSRGGLPLFEHQPDSSGERTVFTVAVERDRYWRLKRATQETRDLVRSGRYSGLVEGAAPVEGGAPPAQSTLDAVALGAYSDAGRRSLDPRRGASPITIA